MSPLLGDPGGSVGFGTRYIVRQQLYTNHRDFTVFDAAGVTVLSAHGNGHGTMENIELRDGAGTAVLEVTPRPGAHPTVEVRSNRTTLLSVGERRVGLGDHFVIDTPLRATFDIVGDAWSTSYTITIDGGPVADVTIRPGLAQADTYSVIIAEGETTHILFGLTLAIDILTHHTKR
jgi:uncharacterized protein YxjI